MLAGSVVNDSYSDTEESDGESLSCSDTEESDDDSLPSHGFFAARLTAKTTQSTKTAKSAKSAKATTTAAEARPDQRAVTHVSVPLWQAAVRPSQPSQAAAAAAAGPQWPKDTKRKQPRPPPDAAGRSTATRAPPTVILDNLNEAQYRAVTSPAATVAILAGPGSGKTHTLTSRVVWLIDRLGYRPQDIIVATFTVKASREMKERIGKTLGDGREKRLVLGTFHSVARRYLSAYGRRIGLEPGFGIVDEKDSKAIVSRIIKRLNIATDAAGARAWISKKKAKGLLGTSSAGNRPHEPQQQPHHLRQKQQYHGSSLPSLKQHGSSGTGGTGSSRNNEQGEYTKNLEIIYAEYQTQLAQNNQLDYDDLLVRCVELLQRHPLCVANVQAVLIDEYQDTNGIQFELMKLFAQARRRITVVGDPDQSIYGWRSADVTNLSRFLAEFSGTAEVSLEENYRSSRLILDTALQVIQQDTRRYQKVLLPVHKKGTQPVLRKLLTAHKEADWIVSEISRALRLTGNLLNYADIAILVRSASLSRAIESSLGSAGIPYRMIGGHKFFDRAEIKVLLDYLRIAHQPSCNDALARIVNVPKRGIGSATIKKLLLEAESEKISLWHLLRQYCQGRRVATIRSLERNLDVLNSGLFGLIDDMRARVEQSSKTTAAQPTAGAEPAKCSLVDIIDVLLEGLQFRNYICQTYGEEDEMPRWANVLEFVKLAEEFMRENDAAGGEDVNEDLVEVEGLTQSKETSVLAKFLFNISLATDAAGDTRSKDAVAAPAEPDDDGGASQEPPPMVTISTIHAAKGLEWPVVFIPAVYDGSLPHSRSEDYDEERRLLYVAMTRAKCLLNVSYTVKGHFRGGGDGDGDGGDAQRTISRFLEPVAKSGFAERGPSYNRALLEEISDILGRPLPSDKAIFQNLEPGLDMEDNLFPVDPISESQFQDRNGNWDGGDDNGLGVDGHWQGPKRRKLLPYQSNTYSLEQGSYGGFGGADSGMGSSRGGEFKPDWRRGYTTTMDNVSNLPGFTTASAHQTALLASRAEAAAVNALSAASAAPANMRTEQGVQEMARRAKRTTGALPPKQMSIASFFLSKGSSSSSSSSSSRTSGPSVPSTAAGSGLQAPARPASAQRGEHQRLPPARQALGQPRDMSVVSQTPRPEVPPGSILPAFAGHTLGGIRPKIRVGHPGALPKPTKGSGGGGDDESHVSRKRYAHFSSSPPPPDPDEQWPQQQQQQQQLGGASGKNPTTGAAAPATATTTAMTVTVNTAIVRPRPAMSFHSTTCVPGSSSSASLALGSYRKRPTAGGLQIAGAIAPMDKLRMPFKPPSIKRQTQG